MTMQDIEDIYPLSPMQQGILFHTLYSPSQAGMYSHQVCYAIRGHLNVLAFKQAWQQISARHSILRTAFFWEGLDEPLEVVQQHVTLPWEQEDWRILPDQEQQERLSAYLQADRVRGFDLAQPPLLHLSLLQLADDHYQFVLNHHSLLMDGWSFALVMQEVFACYNAIRRNRPTNLGRSRSFRDYIAWLQEQDIGAAETFWRQTLRGYTDPTALGVEMQHGTAADALIGYAKQQVILSPDSTTALQQFARQQQFTMNTLVQGAWALLLNRYSGEADVLFGATVSGRPPALANVETMVGSFINTLPVRAQVPPEAHLAEWLRAMQTQQAEQRQYEYTPLAQIQGWSEVARGQSLFDTILVFENYPASDSSEESSADLQVHNIADVEQTNYPITVISWLGAGPSLGLRISYDQSRYSAETIERMLGHLQTLLESMVHNPEKHLNELSLLTPTEYHQLVELWSQPHPAVVGAILKEGDVAVTLAQRFEAQVLRSPDAEAIRYEHSALTYHQLNSRANRIAHHLQALGVGPDVLVGLCIERSLDLVVGILAILKASGAYVPLDPEYPADRLAFMLSDSAVPVVLTHSHLADRLPASTTAHLVFLDDQESVETQTPSIANFAAQADTNPLTQTTANHAAYVIYTSGSTGQPKGVVVPHRQVLRLLAQTEAWYGFGAKDVWTFFHSYAFDFSVWELWGALLYGGRLVVVPYLTSRSPEAFYHLLLEEQVTVLNQTPSAFRQLSAAEETLLSPEHLDVPEKSLALRTVIFGGEALELGSLGPWFARHGDQQPQLVNMYGITETTVHVTYRPVTLADVEAGSGGSVIGHPIPDLRLYVLDRQQRPVPIGVPGELYVGGAGLARGYLNRPELTAERFVPDPFGSTPGARLYRTGDLVRYLPTAELEYLGRVDQQVKIRGHRIELGEIEAVLGTHPEIQECVVVAHQDSAGEKRLVAYVVGNPAKTLTVSQLRQHLQQRLPDYMVPATFVALAGLPLTPSGKLDRRALPAPDTQRLAGGIYYEAPRTIVEEALAGIWAHVLRLERVGIYDNFFELGGDSMRSVQILALARERGVPLSLQQLFQYPTIAELAREIQIEEAGAIVEAQRELAPFNLISEEDRRLFPAEVEDAYPLTALQTGMIFHSEYNPESAIYHNVGSSYIQAPLDVEQLDAAIQRLARRHTLLRTSIALSGYSEPLQLVWRSVRIPVRFGDLSNLSFEEQEARISRIVEEERQSKFDWAQAPLLRFQVHRRSDTTFQLTMTEHHAILDGWSVASLLTELYQCYLALLQGQTELDDTPPSSSFRSYVALEKEALASEETQRYWDEQLREHTTNIVSRWPLTAEDKANIENHEVEALISKELSQDLKRVAQSLAVPIKSVLLAAHLRVFSLLSGETDVLTGLVVNGRPETADGEQILGLFLNTLPYRQRLQGGTWNELIQETFAHEWEQLPYRRYPLAEIQRRQSGQSLFEVAFNFIHFHVFEEVRRLQNLTILGGQGHIRTNFTLMAHFRLDLSDSSNVHLALEYDPEVLSQAQVQAIAGYYTQTLTALASNPDSHYEAQSLLPEPEWQQVVEEWNQTQVAYPEGEQTLPALFAAQVARTPTTEALRFEGVSLTYAQLQERAVQLAGQLQALGVGPEVPVGVCLHRSLELVVALLAVVEAKGAYVPLDPEYPTERLAFMLAECQAPVLLTQPHLLATVDRASTAAQQLAAGVPGATQPSPSSQLLCLDSTGHLMPTAVDATLTAQNSTSATTSRSVRSDHLAYILYTSGSTGRPKGVMNTQRSIVNRLLWMQSHYELTPQDRVLQKTPYSFDVSVWEFFWPLLTGATLVVARPDGHRDPSYLRHLIAQEQITTLHFVPSMLRAFVDELALDVAEGELPETRTPAPDLASVRRVVCSGEALPADLTARFLPYLPAEAVLDNLYGPTEAAIDVSCWPARNEFTASHAQGQTHEPREGTIPIGRAIANTQLYVLDLWLQPVPVGVPGELYIGGVQVARGYLQRPELTAERFLPDPFSRQPGARLYRTGDRVRIRAIDGAIEYLGRLDGQVKLRGQRLELGEIEVVLEQQPLVGQAVVVVREELSGGQRLIAYLTRQATSSTPSANQLAGSVASEAVQPLLAHLVEVRQFAQQRLPDYMVPSAWVVLPGFPLTASGKLDRTALPAPENSALEDAVETYAAPRTPTESLLASIWAQVLQVEQVGLHDNFFALGGDSLLATQAVSRIRQAFHIELPLRSLFEEPTLESLAVHIETLRQAEQGLQAPPIMPADRNVALPLSLAQQRLWFLDQWEPNSSAYTIPMGMWLTGHLDMPALEQSFNALVARHESLRTTFISTDGQATQVITPELHLSIPLVNLSALTKDEQQAEVYRRARAELQRPFDLTTGPLLRATILCLSADEHTNLHKKAAHNGTSRKQHPSSNERVAEPPDQEQYVLLLTMHHIISDGWSTDIIFRELSILYEACTQDAQPVLTPLPIQYADFAVWQREWLQGEVLERHLAYWRQQLAGAPAVLELPLDRPRPPAQTSHGAHLPFALPEELAHSLRALSRREGATLFMTLLATFQALLARYTEQEDIVVGTPIAGRTRAETEGLIGCFFNTLALRTDTSGDPTFRELLKHVREVALESYAHQDLPFEKVVEALDPERSLSYSPLFQVVFSLENVSHEERRLGNLAVRSLAGDTGIARYDLVLSLVDDGQGLNGVMEYNTDLFDRATIERMVGHYQRLLGNVATQPGQRLTQMTLLDAQERVQLLVQWNNTTTAYPADDCLHRLFEAQVARTPNATAVICEGDVLTYDELNRCANRLAHHLRTLGVGPDVLVALLTERSINLLTAILAVFKAGGAYLPLDPEHPAPRLRQVLERSNTHLVLSSADLAPALAGALEQMALDQRPQAFAIEELLEQDQQDQVETDLTLNTTPRNLAYVIYTSGSTGVPKGVMIEHRGMVNHLYAKISDLAINETDSIAQTASQCFDISVWQFLSTLLVGGHVHILPDAIAHGPVELLAQTEQHHITILETVPSLLRAMIETLDPSAAKRPTLTALRWMVPTGEALPPDLCREWLRLYPHIPLTNAYGPTECSDDVTHYKIIEPPAATVLHMPIGEPLANMRMYVLDRRLEPTPLGVHGELYVGGIGVGRGYLNDAIRTAETFIPDPFSDEPGARLYKTGDVVRYRSRQQADGTSAGLLEYIGRVDHQVKIRGYRIELGEIEVALRAHPALRDAVVVAREDRPQSEPAADVSPSENAHASKRLVAYIVADPAYQGGEDQWLDAELPAEQVAQWQSIFDSGYRETPEDHDATFNITTWNSSYTGHPIPAEEMREWVESSVANIRALHPSRVLEIGSGTGLLLLRLAPESSYYWGTDFSPKAIEFVQQEVEKQHLDQVTLSLRGADDFSGMADHDFDTIIINSVAQYFPSIHYLLRVLEGSVRVLKQGGTIYLGDIRCLPWLAAFQTSVELYRVRDDQSSQQLWQRVQKRLEQEEELVIDPAFFTALQAHLPQITQVDIQLKRGRYRNEMTRFRYDVVLTVGDIPSSTAAPIIVPWRSWQEEGMTLQRLREEVTTNTPAALRFSAVPNARVLDAAESMRPLTSDERPETIAELRMALASSQTQKSIDPEDLRDLGAALGYAVTIRPSRITDDGNCEVILRQASLPGSIRILDAEPARPERRAWNTYATNPLQEKLTYRLVPELRRYLLEQLPDYMVPATFVMLDALPLTANGKIDRAALPAPEQTRPELASAFVSPGTWAEQILAEIWAQVLRLERVGIHDNFFELGGDSILSIQVVARAHRAGLQFTPKQLFEYQTIASLAKVADTTLADLTGAIDQEPADAPFTLTPMQHVFIGQPSAHPHDTAEAILVETRAKLEPIQLELALRTVMRRHDALRLRFVVDAIDRVQSNGVHQAGWQQRDGGPNIAIPVGQVDFTAMPATKLMPAIQNLTSELYSSLNLLQGPLMQVALIDCGQQRPNYLLVVVHQLIMDNASWHIFLGDIEAAYQQTSQGAKAQIPTEVAPFKQWARRLAKLARSGAMKEERTFWLAESATQTPGLPLDAAHTRRKASGHNGIGTLTRAISTEETQALLGDALQSYHTRTEELLLTALAEVGVEWMGVSSLRIDVAWQRTQAESLPLAAGTMGEAFERVFLGLDLAQAVGQYSTHLPLCLSLTADTPPAAAIKTIKEQVRRIPNGGLGYGLLRYLSADQPIVSALANQAEMHFSYLGQRPQDLSASTIFQQAQTLDVEASASSQPSHGAAVYPLRIAAYISEGRLQLMWSFNEQLLRQTTVERLAERYNQALRRLIAHCLSTEMGSYTPADFPMAELSQTELDALIKEFE